MMANGVTSETGTQKVGDCNEERLVAHLRIVVDTLADIQKSAAMSTNFSSGFSYMDHIILPSIAEPRSCIDAVWLEGANASYALKCALKGWVWATSQNEE